MGIISDCQFYKWGLNEIGHITYSEQCLDQFKATIRRELPLLYLISEST